MNLHNIFDRYSADLRSVETELMNIFRSDVVIIPVIGRHVLGSGGKRLRPLYLLLSAALAGSGAPERITFAAIIEAIHTASLLHDDVVDGADVRRGKPTSHSLWGNQVVILVGDFLYASALHLAVSMRNNNVMETISQAATRMTEGEILQLQKVADPTVTEEDYIKIIAAKTGALISASCKIGAILGGLSDEKVQALSDFGLKTGIVFQMYDDILDYQADEEKLGKQLGKDLCEGKITLPLIYLLQMSDDAQKEQITEIIKNTDEGKKPEDMQDDLNIILSLFKTYGAIDKSIEKAKQIVEEAKRELFMFDESPEKAALTLMADYALQRKK